MTQPVLIAGGGIGGLSLALTLHQIGVEAHVIEAAREIKQAIGGKLEFQQALKVGFTVFVVANLIYYLYYYLLHGVFDPGLEDVQRAVMAETLEARKSMLTEEQYDAFKASLEGDGLKVGFQNTLLTYARSLIGYFLIALGLAALASRR